MAGVVVIGAGPGIGQAVAKRFTREGMPVALVARNPIVLRNVAAAVAAMGVRAVPLAADCADEAALRAALDDAAEELGPPEVVVYNAAVVRADAPGALPAAGQLDAWAVNVVGALTAATHVAPGMVRRGRGTFLVTGGMPEADPRYTSLSLGKAGVRALVALLDKQYGPAGMHVATVTVAGVVAPGTAFDPALVAEHYWRLHRQPADRWEREVVHRG